MDTGPDFELSNLGVTSLDLQVSLCWPVFLEDLNGGLHMMVVNYVQADRTYSSSGTEF